MKRAQEALKDSRLAEAAALARQDGRQELAVFVHTLFARGAAEDILVYTPAELLAFAESALAGLTMRVPGIHGIRIFNPTWDDDSATRKAVTVVEIVNDDMPFLVDSVMQEVGDCGVDVRLMVHPILPVARGMTGRLLSFGDAAEPDADRESFIHIHIARLPDAIATAQLENRLDQVLTETRSAVEDWPQMRARLTEVISEYKRTPPPLPEGEVAEAIAFLEWLEDNNFTFLGMRDYDVSLNDDGADHVALKPGSGLGLLRDPDVRVLRRGRELVQVTPEVREFMSRPEPLIVAKANVRARVHRHAYMDYVGVKHYDRDGRLVSELRLLGLFTASAYTRSTHSIPYLRRKVQAVMDRAGFDPGSHSAKALQNILDSYPRDELFQIDFDTLLDFAIAILELGERPRIRVLARPEKFDRFVSILAYVPRDRYDTDTRLRIGDYFASVFNGRVSSVYPAFPEGPLARVHYIIGRDEGATPNPSQVELEAAVAAITRTWRDAFQDACRGRFGPARGRQLIEAYSDAFSAGYRDTYDTDMAMDDLALLEQFVGDRVTAIDFRGGERPSPRLTLRQFHRGGSVPLSLRVPVLEAMGFRVLDEKTFEIAHPGGPIRLHDTSLERSDGLEIDLVRHEGRLKAMFMAVWMGAAENDRLNSLTISAGLGWREIAALRALSRYLQQARCAYDQGYIAEVLVRNPRLAAGLIELFRARFEPELEQRPQVVEAAGRAIDRGLEEVSNLDDDRIIRRFRNLIEVTTRTTFYQIVADGSAHPVIAFKFDPTKVDALAEPRPFAEIWVHSPRVEGVHLRFGKVARGGLRWSDRPQDFRTEVLGLVKAQQVKNAVIVPVGAKGGFVPKRITPAMPREDVAREGTAAYDAFVSTLIDLTDNVKDDKVIPPDRTVRYDGDDPYLVVAADKGTASFSDRANGIAAGRGFWLGDAFASGGSAGYDHKKMGITARGAWEAVKRHFREMDIDVQTTAFTVVGVGDMSGDVFGNGMLLSPAIRLVAAFDHRDIFIDPTPDPARSLAERKRLFSLPQSSWRDYDPALISAGGGVFSRQMKAIALSAEARHALGLEAREITPQALIAAILKAPVDLLWFGGIGTYVKAAGESDLDVGDRANDAVRVLATDLRARVVAEGANLGMTQKARVAFSLAGGRCNSDAVDNSAGVNSSDLEVNIKIAFGRALREKRLTLERRNQLLAAMTDDVARLVLANNIRQTLCLSVSRHQRASEFLQERRLIQVLEASGRLDRTIEGLPDDETLTKRAVGGDGLTRPETGVLMAYAKLMLHDGLLAGRLVDDPGLEPLLLSCFPEAMRGEFAADIGGHRLRREILATRLANDMINRGGPAFAVRLMDQTSAGHDEVARAYLMAASTFGIDALEADLGGLSGTIGGELELELHAALRDFLIDAVLWILRNASVSGSHPMETERLGAGVERFRQTLPSGALPDAQGLVAAGVPVDLARRLLSLPLQLGSLDLILVGEDVGAPIDEVAPVMTALDTALGTDRFDRLARRIRPGDSYEARALDLARRMVAAARRSMAARAVTEGGFDLWITARAARVERTRRALDTALDGQISVARLTVAAGLLSDLAA